MKALFAVTLLAAVGPALAAQPPHATIAATEGSVMVNRGETYVAAQPGDALAPGDRIMVLDGAKANLAFADGCALPLPANSIATVPSASPCAGAVADVQAHGPMYAQAVGSTATTTTTEQTTTTTTTTTEEDDDDRKAGYLAADPAPQAAVATSNGRRVGWWIAGGVIAAAIICDQAFDCFDDDVSR